MAEVGGQGSCSDRREVGRSPGCCSIKGIEMGRGEPGLRELQTLRLTGQQPLAGWDLRVLLSSLARVPSWLPCTFLQN